MRISPDEEILLRTGLFDVNLTLATTWLVVAFMAAAARMATRDIGKGGPVNGRQAAMEIIVTAVLKMISDTGLRPPERYVSFLGTLFLFLAVSNLLTVVPYYEPPTGSYSTTAALGVCVFVAVPFFGVRELGIRGYLKTYVHPTFLMLPFHAISEVTRTLALATRLFGNMMSGTMVLALLISIAPLIFPIAAIALGLLTGTVQAYIFTTLATVYIAAAMHENEESRREEREKK